MGSHLTGPLRKSDVKYIYETSDKSILLPSNRVTFMTRANKHRNMNFPKIIVDEIQYQYGNQNKKFLSEDELRSTVYLLEIKALKIDDDWFKIQSPDD